MGLFDKWKGKAADSGASTPSPAVPPKLLRVSDYIKAKNICFFPAGPSKHQVLGQLISSLDLPDPNAALQAILVREEAGSTVIAPGLALPHARIPGITKIAAAIGIVPMEEVRVYVLFLGPSNNMKEHLAFLAGVSALFQSDGLVDKLATLTSPEIVLDTLRAAESSVQE